MGIPSQRKTFAAAGVTIAIVALLVFSPFAGVKAAVVPAGANWDHPDGTAGNQNYNPQTAINAQNVQSLQTSWIFPIPNAPAAALSTLGPGTEGASMTPLVVNGIVYFVTQYNVAYALDAKDGHVFWTTPLPITVNSTLRAAWFIGSLDHYHQSMLDFTTTLWGMQLFWVTSNTYEVFALDASTGKIVVDFHFYNLGESIPGSFGAAPKANSPSLVVDQKRGILITDYSGGIPGSGRGYFQAWDISKQWTGMAAGARPPTLWRTFVMPPQDGSDPNWSLNSVNAMQHAYIFNGTAAIDLKALPASQLQAMLVGDWGKMGFNGTNSYSTTGGAWGGPWALDPNQPILYTATDDITPWYCLDKAAGQSCRPGPGLWSNSILSINETTGAMIWAFQQSSHDLWDSDCSWVTNLSTVPMGGTPTQVLLKTCKSGYAFALDAKTGHMYWSFFPPNVKSQPYHIFHDPRNVTQMRLPWPNYPSNSTIIWRCGATGCMESDLAYDPSRNTAFLGTYNSPYKVTPDPAAFTGGKINDLSVTFTPASPANTTIYALDASTGQVKWSFFIQCCAYRGGLSTSGGVVYAITSDGTLWMVNADTGKLIATQSLGGPLRQQPSIAADSAGNMKVFLSDGAPGVVMALGLSPSAAASASTVTSVSTSIVTAGGSVTTSTVTAAGGSASVTTVTASGATTTVTAAGAAPSTGIDPTTFYAVAGLAVVLVIISGALAVRLRRHAPS